MPNSSSTLSLLYHTAALIAVYSMYSILQEKIMRTSYGPAGSRFTSAPILVFANRLTSLTVGLCLSIVVPAFRSHALLEHTSKPKLPLHFYAAVAAANFASTYCQYDALRYVGFTTQALAKCAKMVPVLILGRFLYRKGYKPKDYIAASVVLTGCAFYLTSHGARSATTSRHITNPQTHDWSTSLTGFALLSGYLLFDGLTSTSQEHFFGKSKRSESPLSPGSAVLDQMIYVNLCAAIISATTCMLDLPGSILNIRLIQANPDLLMDIMLLSATASLGVIILYNTIFSHGALTVATTMTLRQFFSILLNAGIFGNLGNFSLGAWTGIGLVAAGVFIKMDRRFDEDPQAIALPVATSTEKHESNSQQSEPVWAAQYGVPIAAGALSAIFVDAIVCYFVP